MEGISSGYLDGKETFSCKDLTNVEMSTSSILIINVGGKVLSSANSPGKMDFNDATSCLCSSWKSRAPAGAITTNMVVGKHREYHDYILAGQKSGCFPASRGPFRFVLLFFTCMSIFGCYFCLDMPSVLQNTFTLPLHPNDTLKNCITIDGKRSERMHLNGTDCTSGLGLTETQYNLLYSVYAWTNAVVVILAGFLIDKVGNPIGTLLFSFLCLAGTSLFAAGLYCKGNPSMMFLLFLLGRLLLGSGNGSLIIIQSRMSAVWFKDKELAFSFGCILAFSRLASGLNFFLTESFEEKYDLHWTLWGGAILCGFGCVCAIITSILDAIGLQQMEEMTELKIDSKNMRLTDVKYFSSTFWLLASCLMFFYVGLFPFIADASKFIYVNYKEMFHLSKKTSAYIVGSVYLTPLVLGPVMGLIVDMFGRRGILIFICAVQTVPVYGILAFAPRVHPLVSTVWLGFIYSVAAAALWPSVPLIVDQASVGTALGITSSIQMIGTGVANVIVGKILDLIVSGDKWKYVMIFFLANSLACVLLAIFLNINDRRKGGILNHFTRSRGDALINSHTNTYGSVSTAGYTNKDALLYDSSTSIN
ncbi:lysosomal dipeptide transporter MFSD1-like isoform X2 [Acropora palmata]